MSVVPSATPAVPLAIDARGIRRIYKTKQQTVVALDGIDLAVEPGEFFGLLGPNGAGKTTLIKILTTLLLPSEGTARVFGFDVATQTKQLRRIMNMVAGGEQSGYGMLTVHEQLWMFSQFYGMNSKVAYARIDELLERLGIASVAKRQISGLSSGMRQKMNLVRGLMTDPRVLFLDEPTVALDVGAARDLRDEVRRWMAEDPTRTVILTTHYMQEADDLCDRIAIVNRGKIVIEGTPQSLKLEVQRDVVVDLQLEPGVQVLDRLREVEGVGAASVREEDGVDRFSLLLADDAVLTHVISAVERSGRRVAGLAKREPTLEDAFVKLVGRSMSEEETE